MNTPPGTPSRAAPAGQLLGHLYEVGRLIQDLDEPEGLLDRILDLALQVVGAERGMILLQEEGDESLVPVALRHMDSETVQGAVHYSHTAVREALAGRPVMALDVASDPRLSQVMSRSLHAIRSLVCVPLRLRDRVTGVLYLDSSADGEPFQQESLRFLTAFAAQASLALDSSRLYRRLRRENRELTRQVRDREKYEGLLGRSHAMQVVYALLDRAADSPFPALIKGETGTGKELAARALHQRSPRHNQPFLAVNCSAFSEHLLESELFGHCKGAFTGADSDRKGLFELAHRGTLFLDEIGGMSPSMQAKLLRVLQESEFRRLGDQRPRRSDVRIVAATHMDLEAMVQEKSFREDLYYRLNVIGIDMPPLRARTEDIPMLVRHFTQTALGAGNLKPPRLQAAALRELTNGEWPGNVRELEHTVQKLVLYARGGDAGVDLVRKLMPPRNRVQDALPAAPGGFPSLRQVEARHIQKTLEACQGDREEAARRLGIGRATVYRKIKDFDLEVPQQTRRRRSRD